MTTKLTFWDILRTYGVEPCEVRLIRHIDEEIPVLDTFNNDLEKFTVYTALQKPNKSNGRYGDSKYLAVFCSARGTTALFLGLWEIKGYTENKDLIMSKHSAWLRNNGLGEKTYLKCDYYNLKLTEKLKDLSQRLVIEWGKSQNCVQKKDKDVMQIKPVNSIGDFISYDSTLLSYADLKELIKNRDSNASWSDALSTVHGVYLIRHKKDGRLYVGSAYGEGGILGRWAAYAKTGHANNKLLKGLNPKKFEFSILEICPKTMSEEDIGSRENRWKKCLGTREFGLNDN